jgi:hypothetical protein
MADQPNAPNVDRGILVFCIWSVLGFLGLAIVLEGFRLDSWALSAGGVATVLFAFGAHMIVNAVFATGFSRGETALGIGAYGLLGLIFVLGAASGSMSQPDYYAGLTFFGALAAGFIAYLSTRHGLRGAFSRFHVKAGTQQGAAE